MLASLPLETARERALLMRSMSMFTGVDDDSLALIAGHARTRVFAPGAVLAREHTPVEEVFAVVRGRVTATRGGRVVRLPEPASSMVGLLSLLARDPTGFHVVAEVETVVLELPTQVVLDVLEEHFVMVRQLLRLAARALMGRLRQLGSRAGMLAESLSVLPNQRIAPRPAPPSASRAELVLRLRELPMFARVDLDALFAILDHVTPHTYAPGDVLWREGDRIQHTVMLEAGVLRCQLPEGESIDVEAPGLLGRLEAIAGEPARYVLSAVTPARAQRMDMAGMLTVMESHFDMALNMLAILSGALIELPEEELIARVRGDA
jgi:CRP-like cAMP-binding protein